MIVGGVLTALKFRRWPPGTRAAAVIYANGYDPKDGTLAAIELHERATPVLHHSEPRVLPALNKGADPTAHAERDHVKGGRVAKRCRSPNSSVTRCDRSTRPARYHVYLQLSHLNVFAMDTAAKTPNTNALPARSLNDCRSTACPPQVGQVSTTCPRLSGSGRSATVGPTRLGAGVRTRSGSWRSTRTRRLLGTVEAAKELTQMPHPGGGRHGSRHPSRLRWVTDARTCSHASVTTSDGKLSKLPGISTAPRTRLPESSTATHAACPSCPAWRLYAHPFGGGGAPCAISWALETTGTHSSSAGSTAMLSSPRQ